MKQIFDWLRSEIIDRTFLRDGTPLINVHALGNIINEAEAKWGCHAICYLDSPCEYQNEDVKISEVE